MKLLYCIPGLYNPGGMERVLTQKVNYLADKGYEIDIATTEQKKRKPYFPLHDKIRIIDLNINFNDEFNSNLLKKTITHFKKNKQYKDALINLQKKENYDVIISLCGKEIEFISSLRRRSKVVAELHFAQNFKEQFLVSRNNNLSNRILGKIMTKLFIRSTQKLDKLVVLTKEDELLWKKTNDNVIQIYNSCPFNEYYFHESVIKRFISVGRLDAQKGYDYIVDVWKKVVESYPDWVLDIYGKGEWEELLQNRIRELGLSNNVFLRGVSNDIKNEYRKSYGYILTSRYEGFGMVLVEGMSQGLPCVAFDCKSGPKEIIDDSINGYLVDLGDTETMSNRIKCLIGDINKRNAFSKAAIEKAKLFSESNIMKQWENLFTTLCDGN